jgi:hypothetical protein
MFRLTFDGSKGRQRTGKENLDLDACSQKVGQLGESRFSLPVRCRPFEPSKVNRN